MYAGTWIETFGSEYAAFCERVDADQHTALDPYGAEGVDEFFAVASEAFFVSPPALATEHPAVYDLLRRYYRQDPATRLAGRGPE